jgi:putative intracellular protease/amidase
MKVLFIISNSETAFWLSEVTHPYWHLTERGIEVDFASPEGGKVLYDPYSDPYFANTTEPDDLVSKGFLSDPALVAKLETTLKLRDVDLSQYAAVHVAGGPGATFDLFPSEDVTQALEHFWKERKVVAAICHGAIALGNNPDRILGRKLTGYTLEGDQELQRMFGKDFLIPHYPQTVLEKAGAAYSRVAANDPYVIKDGRLVTGQNQQSASEYALVLLRALMAKCQSMTGIYLPIFIQKPDLIRSGLEFLVEHAVSGRLKAKVAETLPLSETAEAHRALEERRVTGIIVLDPRT